MRSSLSESQVCLSGLFALSDSRSAQPLCERCYVMVNQRILQRGSGSQLPCGVPRPCCLLSFSFVVWKQGNRHSRPEPQNTVAARQLNHRLPRTVQNLETIPGVGHPAAVGLWSVPVPRGTSLRIQNQAPCRPYGEHTRRTSCEHSRPPACGISPL